MAKPTKQNFSRFQVLPAVNVSVVVLWVVGCGVVWCCKWLPKVRDAFFRDDGNQATTRGVTTQKPTIEKRRLFLEPVHCHSAGP
jgi:hypothetical protein